MCRLKPAPRPSRPPPPRPSPRPPPAAPPSRSSPRPCLPRRPQQTRPPPLWSRGPLSWLELWPWSYEGPPCGDAGRTPRSQRDQKWSSLSIDLFIIPMLKLCVRVCACVNSSSQLDSCFRGTASSIHTGEVMSYIQQCSVFATIVVTIGLFSWL